MNWTIDIRTMLSNSIFCSWFFNYFIQSKTIRVVRMESGIVYTWECLRCFIINTRKIVLLFTQCVVTHVVLRIVDNYCSRCVIDPSKDF